MSDFKHGNYIRTMARHHAEERYLRDRRRDIVGTGEIPLSEYKEAQDRLSHNLTVGDVTEEMLTMYRHSWESHYETMMMVDGNPRAVSFYMVPGGPIAKNQ